MALGQDIERLADVPLLGLMEPEALRLLAFSGETRILLTGDSLFRRGERSDSGFLILSGSVAMVENLDDESGAPSFGPGILLGETALIRETVHQATALAQETSTVFKLPRTLFLRVLDEYPASAQRILTFLARRLHGVLTELREGADLRG